MDWTELSITVPTEHIETAAAIAQVVVPHGIYIEDYSDLRTEAPKIAHIDLIDEELLARDTTRGIIHIYLAPGVSPAEALAFLEQRLVASGVPFELATQPVREQEWATAWKQYYHPLSIGRRLLVCPSWEVREPQGDEVLLLLDPGMAFGTGTHETTRLCLEMLEGAVGGGERILDIGCGSGILSIAGVLLGAREAVGVEIDAHAVKVAQENSVLNNTHSSIKFLQGDLVSCVDGRYEIICANIVADAIIRLLPLVQPFMAPGGVLIASGIIDEREAEVLAAAAECGMRVTERAALGGWVALGLGAGE